MSVRPAGHPAGDGEGELIGRARHEGVEGEPFLQAQQSALAGRRRRRRFRDGDFEDLRRDGGEARGDLAWFRGRRGVELQA